jgi:hypothetical protein
MPKCGHCKQNHPSAADIWNCFVLDHTPEDKSSVSLKIEAQKQSVENEVELDVTKFFSSCGTPFHFHKTLEDKRICYIQKSNKKFIPPEGIREFVFITQEGEAFHNSKNCFGLSGGQREAARNFKLTHPVKRVTWRSIRYERYEPCKVCVKVRSEWSK